MSPVDGAVLAVMGVALLRGVWIGMVRETFSVAAIAAACIAVRFATVPATEWLLANASFEIDPLTAKIAAGCTVGLAAALLVGTAGRLLARMLRSAGLGLADRLAGGAIGIAEGALLVGLALFAATWLIGRDHPLLTESRTLETFERVETLARQSPPLPPVSSN